MTCSILVKANSTKWNSTLLFSYLPLPFAELLVGASLSRCWGNSKEYFDCWFHCARIPVRLCKNSSFPVFTSTLTALPASTSDFSWCLTAGKIEERWEFIFPPNSGHEIILRARKKRFPSTHPPPHQWVWSETAGCTLFPDHDIAHIDLLLSTEDKGLES